MTESGEQPASPAEPSTPSSVASLTKEQQKEEIDAKEEIAKAKGKFDGQPNDMIHGAYLILTRSSTNERERQFVYQSFLFLL